MIHCSSRSQYQVLAWLPLALTGYQKDGINFYIGSEPFLTISFLTFSCDRVVAAPLKTCLNLPINQYNAAWTPVLINNLHLQCPVTSTDQRIRDRNEQTSIELTPRILQSTKCFCHGFQMPEPAGVNRLTGLITLSTEDFWVFKWICISSTFT